MVVATPTGGYYPLDCLINYKLQQSHKQTTINKILHIKNKNITTTHSTTTKQYKQQNHVKSYPHHFTICFIESNHAHTKGEEPFIPRSTQS